jgi:hypothetical protein
VGILYLAIMRRSAYFPSFIIAYFFAPSISKPKDW